MATLLLRLVEMVDIQNFDFLNEITHCASIVQKTNKPLAFNNGVDLFDQLCAEEFISNSLDYKGELFSREIELRVIGSYDQKVDLVCTFEFIVSDVSVNSSLYIEREIYSSVDSLSSKKPEEPCSFVKLFRSEELFESSIEFCLLYLESRQDKKAVLWACGTTDENIFLSYSELFYLWERFKGKEMEAHEWFIYGWPEILEMRAAQKSYE
jgi:hypothetical protein